MKRRTLSEKPIQAKKRVIHHPGPGQNRTIVNKAYVPGALVSIPHMGRGAIGVIVEGPSAWVPGLGMMATDNLALRNVYVKVMHEGEIIELHINMVRLIGK